MISKDPTNTLTRRKQAISLFGGRLEDIRRKAVKYLSSFDDETLDSEKIEEFKGWIDKEAVEVLTEGKDGNNWFYVFLFSAYVSGAIKSYKVLDKVFSGAEIISPETKKRGVFVIDGLVKHKEVIKILKNKSFTDLKDISAYVSSQLSSALSDGVLKGDSIKKITKDIAKITKSIKKNRASLIARTEIVKAHNLGSVKEAERWAEITEQDVLLKWISRKDDRVRDDHLERNGKIFTAEQVKPLLGDYNCRCSITAHVEKN